MAKIHWKSGATGAWADSANWAGSVVPGVHDDAKIASGSAEIANSVVVHSLQIANLSTEVSIDAATAVSVAGNFVNGGNLEIDAQNGGSRLSIGGTFTNSGYLTVGDFGLSSSTTVTAAALINSGFIFLVGNGTAGTTAQATLDVKSAAPTTFEGLCDLSGDALLEFASGSIDTIGAGAELMLGGAQSTVADAGATNTNGALSNLSSNEGSFGLGNGVSLIDTASSFQNQEYMILEGARFSVAGSFVNSDRLFVDMDQWDGGSHLTIGGTLSISGDLPDSFVLGNEQLSASDSIAAHGLVCASNSTVDIIGNTDAGSHDQATLNILSAAPATLTGGFRLEGDALLAFASGGITRIAAGSGLEIDGAQARVAIAGALGTNSALQNLADNEGDFGIGDEVSVHFGAAVFTNGAAAGMGGFGGCALTFAGDLSNAGSIGIDAGSDVSNRTTLISIAGALTNSGTITVSTSDYSLAPSTFTTHTFNNGGTLVLEGSVRPDVQEQSSFEVTAGNAPTILDATFQLSGDALLEFASGKIGTIASDGSLSLSGTQARIAVAGKTDRDSALNLRENDGALHLSDGASLASPAAAFTNGGALLLDSSNGAAGGSFSLAAGTLHNGGSLRILDGSSMTVKALNTQGAIAVASQSSSQSVLDVTSGVAPATLVSNASISLSGTALFEFAHGSIVQIADHASLTIDGSQAFLADAQDASANGALSALAANAGALSLLDGAAVATGATQFANAGNLVLEGGASFSGPHAFSNTGQITIDTDAGGSTFSVGNFQNRGDFTAGNDVDTTATTLAALNLTNSGAITLVAETGAPTIAFTIDGTISNTGTITLDAGTSLIASPSGSSFSQGRGLTELDGGDLSAATIAIRGGALEGNGQLTGAVTNAGTVAADLAVSVPPSAELIIHGSYAQTATGTLETTIVAASNEASLLAIGGSATLAGTLQLDIQDPDALQAKQRFVVLDFAGQLTGTFDKIVDGSFTGDGSRVDIGDGLSLVATYDNAHGDVFLQVVKTANLPPATDAYSDAAGAEFDSANPFADVPHHHGDYLL
ncbi:MAG TPA: hypothetical protein VGG10_10150 [Rhizomicrobium sp.]|jgi:hypothetical protein